MIYLMWFKPAVTDDRKGSTSLTQVAPYRDEDKLEIVSYVDPPTPNSLSYLLNIMFVKAKAQFKSHN